jgi:hypothetical protein
LFQLAGISLTVVIAIVAGMVTGAILRAPAVKQLTREEMHKDDIFWEVPQEKEV